MAGLGAHLRAIMRVGERMVGGTRNLEAPNTLRQLAVVMVGIVLALPLVLLAAVPTFASVRSSTPAAANAAPRLPDLRMGPIQDLRIRTSPDGRRLLRFSALLVNVGAGPFELKGWRPSTKTPEMKVTQHVYNSAGGYRGRPTTARMFFSGDGHDHWHVKDLQKYTLKRLDSDRPARVGPKQGFCVYDFAYYNLTLPGAPGSKKYREANTCGEREDEKALQVDMGLSVGWADKYVYFLPYQWIDITGLPPGTYRLRAVTDWKNEFKERRESNNATWVTIKLERNRVELVWEGPVPRYCGRGRWC